MADVTFEKIRRSVQDCIDHQVRSVTDWHFGEPVYEDADAAPELIGLEGLRELVARQHWANFQLWHVEDRARRKDVDAKVIADCKYAIDGLNQLRNDLIERVDNCLVQMIMPILPEGGKERFNTETIGMALDRLSILALKLYHMEEQTRRKDVDSKHVDSCTGKCAVIRLQHDDLTRSVMQLLEEYEAGSKRPKVYFQFKMYNDPELNPELYENKQ